MKDSRCARLLISLGLLCATLALGACAKPLKVSSTAEPTAHLSSYRSYGFVPLPATNIEGKTTQLTIYFMKAVGQEMQARGFKYTEDSPDLLVNFNARMNAVTETKDHVSPMYGYSDYYGYRTGLYGYSILGAGSDVETVQIKSGSANVDVVDAAKKQLVWVGLVEGRLNEDAMANPEPTITQVVSEMFAQFPGRAAR